MTDKTDAADAKAADAKTDVAKLDDGSPKLDFLTYDEAAAQAKALGGKASVEGIGVAFRVNRNE